MDSRYINISERVFDLHFSNSNRFDIERSSQILNRNEFYRVRDRVDNPHRQNMDNAVYQTYTLAKELTLKVEDFEFEAKIRIENLLEYKLRNLTIGIENWKEEPYWHDLTKWEMNLEQWNRNFLKLQELRKEVELNYFDRKKATLLRINWFKSKSDLVDLEKTHRFVNQKHLKRIRDAEIIKEYKQTKNNQVEDLEKKNEEDLLKREKMKKEFLETKELEEEKLKHRKNMWKEKKRMLEEQFLFNQELKQKKERWWTENKESEKQREKEEEEQKLSRWKRLEDQKKELNMKRIEEEAEKKKEMWDKLKKEKDQYEIRRIKEYERLKEEQLKKHNLAVGAKMDELLKLKEERNAIKKEINDLNWIKEKNRRERDIQLRIRREVKLTIDGKEKMNKFWKALRDFAKDMESIDILIREHKDNKKELYCELAEIKRNLMRDSQENKEITDSISNFEEKDLNSEQEWTRRKLILKERLRDLEGHVEDMNLNNIHVFNEEIWILIDRFHNLKRDKILETRNLKNFVSKMKSISAQQEIWLAMKKSKNNQMELENKIKTERGEKNWNEWKDNLLKRKEYQENLREEIDKDFKEKKEKAEKIRLQERNDRLKELNQEYEKRLVNHEAYLKSKNEISMRITQEMSMTKKNYLDDFMIKKEREIEERRRSTWENNNWDLELLKAKEAEKLKIKKELDKEKINMYEETERIKLQIWREAFERKNKWIDERYPKKRENKEESKPILRNLPQQPTNNLLENLANRYVKENKMPFANTWNYIVENVDDFIRMESKCQYNDFVVVLRVLVEMSNWHGLGMGALLNSQYCLYSNKEKPIPEDVYRKEFLFPEDIFGWLLPYYPSNKLTDWELLVIDAIRLGEYGTFDFDNLESQADEIKEELEKLIRPDNIGRMISLGNLEKVLNKILGEPSNINSFRDKLNDKSLLESLDKTFSNSINDRIPILNWNPDFLTYRNIPREGNVNYYPTNPNDEEKFDEAFTILNNAFLPSISDKDSIILWRAYIYKWRQTSARLYTNHNRDYRPFLLLMLDTDLEEKLQILNLARMESLVKEVRDWDNVERLPLLKQKVSLTKTSITAFYERPLKELSKAIDLRNSMEMKPISNKFYQELNNQSLMISLEKEKELTNQELDKRAANIISKEFEDLNLILESSEKMACESRDQEIKMDYVTEDSNNYEDRWDNNS